MAGPVRLAIIANGTQAKAEISAISRSVSRMGAVVKTAAVAGFAGATYAAVTFGKESIKAASDAQQSVGATQAVYGKYAREVIRTSRQAAQAVGLSANEYRELANVTGAMLQSSGIPLRRTTQLTEQLNQRAADVAATFGGSAREAVEAFSALLRGETDPVERYGVSIKESDISARLAAKGLDKLEGSALKQAQAQARLDLLFQQTAKSQGMFRRESDTLAGQQQRLAASWDNLQAKIGKALLPSLTQLVAYGNREVVPWISRTVTALKDTDSPVRQLASTVGDDLGPALTTLGTALQDAGPELAKIREDLPSLTDISKVAATGIGFLADNVDTLGAALPFLAAGFVAVKGAQAAANAATLARVPLLLAQTRATRELAAATRELATAQGAQGRAAAVSGNAASAASGKMSRLALAARGAAGIGGLGALAAGAGQADSGMGTLLTTLGGAATGFAIGGPVGLAAGAILSYASASGQAASAQGGLNAAAQELIGTLDQQTGAFTRATRASITKRLEDQGLLQTAQGLGLPLSDLTRAVLQGEEAILRFRTKALEGEWTDQGRTDIVALSDEMRLLSEEVFGAQTAFARTSEAMGGQGKKFQQARQQVRNLADQYDLIPNEVRTIVKQIGTEPSERNIKRLARQYETTPNAVRTLVAVLGSEQAVRRLNSIKRGAEDVGRARPNLQPWLAGLSRALTTGEGSARRGGRGVQKGLEDGPGKAKADLSGFTTSVRNGARPAVAVGTQGGLAVGNALGEGVISGFAGTQARLVSAATAAVRAAVAAAKAAGKIKSPSQVMRDEVGVQLGRGLEIGLASRKGKAKDAGRDLVRSVLEGATGGTAKIGPVLDKITSLIEKRVKAKDSKVEKRREREILKHLRDEFTALRKNGREQDRNIERLKAARDNYKRLVDEAKQYATGIRDSFVAFGNVVGLGVDEESGTTSLGGIVGELQDRVKRAYEFQQLILRLRNQGLNGTTLQQLIDAGPEAALATAQAIAGGGASAAEEINRLTASLASAGGSLGEQMRYTFRQSGIDQAAALVTELERRQHQLDRAAKQMARVLVREVERELAREAGRQADKRKDRDQNRDTDRLERRRRDADLAAAVDRMRTEMHRDLQAVAVAAGETGPQRAGAAAGEAAGHGAMRALQGHTRNRLQGGPLG